METDREDMVVPVRETNLDDEEYDYETLLLIPREKLLDELGATAEDDYLQVCPDDELRVLVHQARKCVTSSQAGTSTDRQLGTGTDRQAGTGATPQAGTNPQALALDFEKQRSEVSIASLCAAIVY